MKENHGGRVETEPQRRGLIFFGHVTVTSARCDGVERGGLWIVKSLLA
jgi:hypothetical protein